MTTIPSTMKAVLLKGHGGFEQLEYRDDVPVPLPKTGEVLVRVAAAGVNNTDINTRSAWYSKGVTEGTTSEGGVVGYAAARADDTGWTGAALGFPRIQGADVCGRIGERVLIEPVASRSAGSRVCRYLLRPPLALERLTESSSGQLLYEFRRPWSDGSTALLLDPPELLERLAALVPPPRRPLVNSSR